MSRRDRFSVAVTLVILFAVYPVVSKYSDELKLIATVLAGAVVSVLPVRWLRRSGLRDGDLRVLRYWRQSLTDGARFAESSHLGIYDEALAHGKLTAMKTLSPGAVLVAPVVFTRGNGEQVVPIWIPAHLTESGAVTPRAQPWIPRSQLEPVVSDTEITFGEVGEFESQVDRNPFDLASSWDEAVRYAADLFKRVSGELPGELEVVGYTKRDWFIAPDSSVQAVHIERLYDAVIGGKVELGAAGVLSRQGVVKSAPAKQLSTSLYSGHFSSSYPLAPSQRVAVTNALKLKDGEILAVTGPPGTGKTTLIQSLLASLVVNAALRGERPPLVVCAAATNQATLNVIESFSHFNRLLPDIESLGLFCVSDFRAASGREITVPFIKAGGEGTLNRYESLKYVERATPVFLEKLSQKFGRCRSLPKAERLLRSQLKKVSAKGRRLSEDERDTEVRARAFQLAIYYYEARWLQEISKVLDRGGKVTWEIRAMLTPCFVSTFYMLPRFFFGRHQSTRLEMIIADESGQVPVEVAGVVFALARKGVIVGDPMQLEPVWSVPEFVDRGNLKRFRVKEEDSSILASRGSLMLRALAVSRKQVFLSEQRRSVPGIVSFINELCYGGRLEPKRGEGELLPPFAYYQVRGRCNRSGRSRVNEPEARAVAELIRKLKPKLEQHYQKPLSEVLGVLTPFVAQALALRHLIPERGILVGTVGSLQGAEREVIIFSSVYDLESPGELLFNRGTNLLNVAVSRARDSFIVVGEIELFHRQGDSAILGRYLSGNRLGG
jgi:energy-coupling factor transporter ATP-binding protein EcfA2